MIEIRLGMGFEFLLRSVNETFLNEPLDRLKLLVTPCKLNRVILAQTKVKGRDECERGKNAPLFQLLEFILL